MKKTYDDAAVEKRAVPNPDSNYDYVEKYDDEAEWMSWDQFKIKQKSEKSSG